MRGLGKLIRALNPLEQSAMSQIQKVSSGMGVVGRALNYGRAGAAQIAKGGYFRGKNLAYMGGEFRSLSGGNLNRGIASMGNVRQARRGLASTRKATAGIAGAWIGLNLLAPDSSMTSMANVGVVVGGVGALAYAKGPAALGSLGRKISGG